MLYTLLSCSTQVPGQKNFFTSVVCVCVFIGIVFSYHPQLQWNTQAVKTKCRELRQVGLE
jgi:hypothetical protein